MSTSLELFQKQSIAYIERVPQSCFSADAPFACYRIPQAFGLVLFGYIAYLFAFHYMKIIYRKCRIAYGIRNLPGPKGLPVLGLLPELNNHLNDLYLWKIQLAQTYGATYATPVDLLQDGSISITSPTNLEYILNTNFTNFIKPAMMQESLNEIMGNCIFATNPSDRIETINSMQKETWHFQRKIIAQMFSVNSFRSFIETIFLHHTKGILTQLEDAAKQEEMVNLENVLLTLTTNITYNMGFGMDLPEDIDTESFHALFRELSSLSVARFTKPWYRWFYWCMPSEYKLKRAFQGVDKICYDIIERQRKSEPRNMPDVLSYLLKQQCQGVNITDSFIRDMIMTIMLAGRETIASGIMWVIYNVSKYPEVEAKIVEEIKRIAGDKKIDYNMAFQLTYLDAVVKETWRLFPPIPYELKCAVKDDVLPDGTFVPAGVNVEYSPMVMGRDPTRWENAIEFKPERWLDPTFRPTAYEFPVFQGGPRTCVGQRIAYLQSKVVLATLLRKFHFIIDHPFDQEPEYTLGIALFMKDGMHAMPVLRTT